MRYNQEGFKLGLIQGHFGSTDLPEEENITSNKMSQELLYLISPKYAIFGGIPGRSNINNRTANVVIGLEIVQNSSRKD